MFLKIDNYIERSTSSYILIVKHFSLNVHFLRLCVNVNDKGLSVFEDVLVLILDEIRRFWVCWWECTTAFEWTTCDDIVVGRCWFLWVSLNKYAFEGEDVCGDVFKEDIETWLSELDGDVLRRNRELDWCIRLNSTGPLLWILWKVQWFWEIG